MAIVVRYMEDEKEREREQRQMRCMKVISYRKVYALAKAALSGDSDNVKIAILSIKNEIGHIPELCKEFGELLGVDKPKGKERAR